MRSNGTIKIYDSKNLSYKFQQLAGETYLTMGPDNVCFHVNVPDYDGRSSVARKPLPQELVLEVTAKAVFEQAYLQGHMSRDGKIGDGSNFPNVSAQVRAGRVFPNESKLVYAVWARRIDSVPTAHAA